MTKITSFPDRQSASGLPISELVDLRWDQIDFNAGNLLVQCMDRCDVLEWQARLNRLPFLQRVADRAILLDDGV